MTPCPLWTFLFLLVLVIHAFDNTVLAQVPTAATALQYATLDETTLFIFGGSTVSQSTLGQLYSLDLTTAWADTSPPWKALPSGPPTSSKSMAVSPDKSSIVVYDLLNGISTFNISRNQWTSTLVKNTFSVGNGLAAVANPDNGKAYIPLNQQAPLSGMQMIVIPFPNGTAYSFSGLPAKPVTLLYYYGAVWSSMRGTILYYGGGSLSTLGNGNTQFTEFSPSKNTWEDVVTTGVSPPGLKGHCMVSALSGAKMVLFGGYTTVSPAGTAVTQGLGSIFILDVKTMVWRQGPNLASSTDYRGGMACTASGAMFIAWGGDNMNVVQSAKPLIYNMQTDTWVNQFTPGTPDTPGPSGSTNAGAIGGAVAGVAVVAFIIGFVFLRRRKARQLATKETGPLGVPSSGDAHPSQHGSLPPSDEQEEKKVASWTNPTQYQYPQYPQFGAPTTSAGSNLSYIQAPFFNGGPINHALRLEPAVSPAYAIQSSPEVQHPSPTDVNNPQLIHPPGSLDSKDYDAIVNYGDSARRLPYSPQSFQDNYSPVRGIDNHDDEKSPKLRSPQDRLGLESPSSTFYTPPPEVSRVSSQTPSAGAPQQIPLHLQGQSSTAEIEPRSSMAELELALLQAQQKLELERLRVEQERKLLELREKLNAK